MISSSMAKHVAWLAAGIVIGVAAATSASALKAQPGPAQTGRLIFTTASNSTGASTVFIFDSKSKGCWFAIGTASGVFSGVAQAPDEACR